MMLMWIVYFLIRGVDYNICKSSVVIIVIIIVEISVLYFIIG